MAKRCSIEAYDCPIIQTLSPERAKPLTRIFVEGPQGSGKTTLSIHLSELLSAIRHRGFPSGEVLKMINSQAAVCLLSLESTLDGASDTVILDRSPLSHYIYLARKSGNVEIYKRCAIQALERYSQVGTSIFIFIESTPELCDYRQDHDDTLAIDKREVEDELKVYREFYEAIRNSDLPNVHVIKVDNGPEVSLDDFIQGALSSITPIINHQ